MPGSDLPTRDWVALNRLRKGHGRLGYTLHKWGLRPPPGCDCGHENQIVAHIADMMNADTRNDYEDERKNYTDPQRAQNSPERVYLIKDLRKSPITYSGIVTYTYTVIIWL